MEKIGIVGCSNGTPEGLKWRHKKLLGVLEAAHMESRWSPFLYSADGTYSGTGPERAKALMDFFRDPEITRIFDLSGGDMANEILPYLDFSEIAQSKAEFWGYSDLTAILNSIYTKTGKTSVLWQLQNLIYEQGKLQKQRFFGGGLFDLSWEFLRGREMEGILVGGNIRCFLKLAGTEFFPDLRGKILLLESYGGTVPQMVTYLSQLRLLPGVSDLSGILLGTFSKMESEACRPTMEELVQNLLPTGIPIAKTREIGHGPDAKAARIGQFYRLQEW